MDAAFFSMAQRAADALLRKNFEIGHVVRLVCGSLPMVIVGFDEDAGDSTQEGRKFCLCLYQRPNGELVTARVDIVALMPDYS